MRISIVGTGYVGLVTGACLADLGHQVVCVDVDGRKVEMINAKRAPIHEADLDDLLRKHVGRKLRATTDLESAVLASDVTFIATGTPFDGRQIDLSAVTQAAEQVGAALAKKGGYHAVVVKSTVVPGTTDRVVRPILERASGKHARVDFGLGMNPEFLSEGVAVEEFMNPDRIVLGGVDARTQGVLAEVYAPFDDAVPRLRVPCATAEMIKYASNALQATAISFANEIGNLCAALGDGGLPIDAMDVMAGVHAMKELTPTDAAGNRVAAPITRFLSPGCGFGGSCFPKDVRALVAHAATVGTPMHLLDAVVRVNDAQPDKVLAILRRHVRRLKGARVTVLGLSFKPDTDDVRESPSLPIVSSLLAEGAVVTAHDPVAIAEARKVLPDSVRFVGRLEEALAGEPDAVVLVTRWDEYRVVPQLLRGMYPENPRLLVDGRRMIDKDTVPCYAGIGLGTDNERAY